jgi:hypothetical protein
MPTNWILGSKFDTTYLHLASLHALWETKWSFPCKISVYPFHDGKLEDFQTIFDKLITDNVNDAYSDTYTEYFLPTARRLAREAEGLEKTDRVKAIELYKRAACVLRISRFPSKDASELKKKTFEEQKDVYLRGAGLWEEPIREVWIPHTAGIEEDEGREVPLYVRLPKGVEERGGKQCPVVLLITGESSWHKEDGVLTI